MSRLLGYGLKNTGSRNGQHMEELERAVDKADIFPKALA